MSVPDRISVSVLYSNNTHDVIARAAHVRAAARATHVRAARALRYTYMSKLYRYMVFYQQERSSFQESNRPYDSYDSCKPHGATNITNPTGNFHERRWQQTYDSCKLYKATSRWNVKGNFFYTRVIIEQRNLWLIQLRYNLEQAHGAAHSSIISKQIRITFIRA